MWYLSQTPPVSQLHDLCSSAAGREQAWSAPMSSFYWLVHLPTHDKGPRPRLLTSHVDGQNGGAKGMKNPCRRGRVQSYLHIAFDNLSFCLIISFPTPLVMNSKSHLSTCPIESWLRIKQTLVISSAALRCSIFSRLYLVRFLVSMNGGRFLTRTRGSQQDGPPQADFRWERARECLLVPFCSPCQAQSRTNT
jgi:hypothetical protein